MGMMDGLSPFSVVVMAHGACAGLFGVVFLLQVFGIATPMLSLQAQFPLWGENDTIVYKVTSFWIAAGMFTLFSYEFFILPYLPMDFQSQVKKFFLLNHIGWVAVVTYGVMQTGAALWVWLPFVTMVGFTIAAALAPVSKSDMLVR